MQGRASLAADLEVKGETYGSSGEGGGAAPVCGAAEQNLTLCKFPILHHGGFVHLAFSEPGRKRDTHSCHQRTPQGSPSLQAAQL